MTSRPRFGIIGAGAIGSVLATFISHAGLPTIVVQSGPRFEIIQHHGLRITGFADLFVPHPRVVQSLDDLSQDERHSVDIWIICTKAWSLSRLIAPLATAIRPDSVVVSTQNGIGAGQMLADAFTPERVACAIMNFVGDIDSNNNGNCIRTAWFREPNYVGMWRDTNTEPASTFAHILSNAGMPTQFVDAQQLQYKIIHKTILNVGLNALCATLDITMKQAMDMPHTRALAKTLMEEAFQIALAMGYDYGQHALDNAMNYLARGGSHSPSMTTDLKRQTKTEIEFINGKIVELAQKLTSIPTPANHFITCMIITREIQNGTRLHHQIPAYLHPTPNATVTTAPSTLTPTVDL